MRMGPYVLCSNNHKTTLALVVKPIEMRWITCKASKREQEIDIPQLKGEDMKGSKIKWVTV